MNKVLCTGGAGFIGSHTVDLLLEKGYTVRILDNLSPPVHQGWNKPKYISKEAEFIIGDIRNKEVVKKALYGIDYIIHLAAYQDYLPDFSKFFDVNSVGTALLYEVIVEEGFPVEKIIVASSQAVYGEGCYKCPADGTIEYPNPRTEEDLKKGKWDFVCEYAGSNLVPVPTNENYVHPYNQYSISKYSQELISLSLGKRYNIPTTCMRYSIVQGARQSFHNAYSGILRIFTQRKLKNLPLVVYEDGQQLRDYVSVHDVARANLLVMEDQRSDFEVYNVGGKKSTTVLEYANLISDTIVIPGFYRFGDTRHIVSDNNKLNKLGWEQKVSLEEIVKEYYDWILTQDDFRDCSEDANKKMLNYNVIRSVENEVRGK